MSFTLSFIIRMFFTMILTLILTPLVRLLAFKVGAVDYPSKRRVNTKPMPTMGGLAIYISFAVGILFLFKNEVPLDYALKILGSALIVLITGIIDDIIELSPKQKLFGILLGGIVAYSLGIRMDLLSVPFYGDWTLGWWSLPFTLLWIAAITNAINLIDGLDGLAVGISIIALTTIGTIGYFFLHTATLYIPMTIFILVAACAGFAPYNFHPAKIYLGDTGALLLGFFISVLSLQGLKNATFISLVTPLIILGVPVTDTIYAMIRRKLNNQKISSADKMHLHHRLLSLGFSQEGAVLTIYGLAITFSFIALLITYMSTLGTILLILFSLLGFELFAELIGLMGEDRQPILFTLRFLGNKEFRENYLKEKKEKKKKK